eukprot:symbB.v1.2.011311.t1/scaffold755.1/size165019/9
MSSFSGMDADEASEKEESQWEDLNSIARTAGEVQSVRQQMEELEQHLQQLAGDDFRKIEGLICKETEMSLEKAKELLKSSATRTFRHPKTDAVPPDVPGHPALSPVSSLVSQIPSSRSMPFGGAADRRAKLQTAARILLR